MIKTAWLISTILSLNLNAKDITKMEDEKNIKIIQVEAFINENTKHLESEINKFLIAKKLKRCDLIDIKFQTSDSKRALLIYEISYDEKK